MYLIDTSIWIDYFREVENRSTIKFTIDCFIAQIAIENDLVLLHNDQDYDRIKSVQPALFFM